MKGIGLGMTADSRKEKESCCNTEMGPGVGGKVGEEEIVPFLFGQHENIRTKFLKFVCPYPTTTTWTGLTERTRHFPPQGYKSDSLWGQLGPDGQTWKKETEGKRGHNLTYWSSPGQQQPQKHFPQGKAYNVHSSPQMQETLLHVCSSGKMYLHALHILKRSKQKPVMQVIHHQKQSRSLFRE